MFPELVLKKASLAELEAALKKGADINELDKSGHSALDIAIDDMQEELANFLLINGAAFESSPLFYSAKRANIDTLKACLAADIAVNTRYHDGFTALIVAVSEAHEHFHIDKELNDPANSRYLRFGQIARLLIEAGANPNLSNDSEQTALHAAGNFGEYEIAKIILETCLSSKKMINLNAEDLYGLTPLHFACRAGNLRVAELLLEWGADANVQEKYGFTPLHEAVESNHIEIVRLLIRKGADKNVSTNVDFNPYFIGTRPYDIAKLRNYKELADLLK
jgi:ankyrin repeat protein